MRVVRNTFRLKYTNFILTNDSGLDKEEKIKIKCYFSLLFLFDFWEKIGKLKKVGTIKQINKKKPLWP